MNSRFILYVLCLFAILSFFHPAASECAEPSSQTTPYTKTKIVMFYVDGLHPDNVEEMVRDHKLPHIEEIFYQNGLLLKYVYHVSFQYSHFKRRVHDRQVAGSNGAQEPSFV